MLLDNKVPATAYTGGLTPHDITVPAQNTGMGLKEISFFQALEITIPKSPGKPPNH